MRGSSLRQTGQWQAITGVPALDAEELLELWVAVERRADERIALLVQKAAEQCLPVQEWRSSALGRKLNTGRHQGVGGLLRDFPGQDLETILAQLNDRGFLLVLDGVLDPHNLGACLRSAEAAGVDAVILPGDNACPVNATVRKASAGSASRVPVCTVTNLSRTLSSLQEAGFWLVGMAGGWYIRQSDASKCSYLVGCRCLIPAGQLATGSDKPSRSGVSDLRKSQKLGRGLIKFHPDAFRTPCLPLPGGSPCEQGTGSQRNVPLVRGQPPLAQKFQARQRPFIPPQKAGTLQPPPLPCGPGKNPRFQIQIDRQR